MSRFFMGVREWFTPPSVRYSNDFCAMVLLTLASVAVGAAITGAQGLLTDRQLQRLSASADALYTSPEFGTLFWRSMCVDLVYCLLCVSGALFALGLAVVWFAVFLRGVSCGMIAAALCSVHGFGGFAFYVLAVLPGTFVSLLAFCYAASSCGRLAKSHFKSYFGFGKQGSAPKTRPLPIVAVWAVCSTAGALLTAALGCVFYQIL